MTQAEIKAEKIKADKALADKALADEKAAAEKKLADEKAKPAEPVYESENLTKLKTEQSTLEDKIDAAGVKTPEGRKLMQELWKVGESIDNEIREIKKTLAAAELDEKRNARVKLFDNAIDAYNAKLAADNLVNAIPADQRELDPVPDNVKSLMDAANAANAAFVKAREEVTNILLSGLPSNAKTGTGATGTATGTKGKTTTEIRELIAPMYAAGKTGTEVRAAIKMHGGGGAWTYFNDGTANAVIKKYEEDNGIK